MKVFIRVDYLAGYLVRYAAGTPSLIKELTCSIISEIRGLMTIVTPCMIMTHIWTDETR